MIIANARDLPLRDRTVQCVVTSPPYYGLRDYGVEGQIGLEPRADCLGWATGDPCGACYVCALRAVFRELWRVLKPDGVAWLNLGDSYATGGGRVGQAPGGGRQGEAWKARGLMTSPNRMPLPGLKPKDLILIPHRVALALQADGWWVRNDIVWSKPNGMPASVTDRAVISHEYVFLLTKAPRYYFDQAAIRNPPSPAFLKELAEGYDGKATKDYDAAGVQDPSAVKANIIRRARHRDMAGRGPDGKGFSVRPDREVAREWLTNAAGTKKDFGASEVAERGVGSNPRTVWHLSPAPYKGSHFATMPPRLARQCILAGSRPGDLVFDPFGGSGTTAAEAERLGRRGLCLDLNPAYIQLTTTRLAETPRGLALEG